MMRNSNDEKFAVAFLHYHVVGKTFEYEALGAVLSGCAGHGHQRNKFFLQQIKRGIHSALKIRPETGLLHFIPRSGLRRFLSRSFENPNFWHQA